MYKRNCADHDTAFAGMCQCSTMLDWMDREYVYAELARQPGDNPNEWETVL